MQATDVLAAARIRVSRRHPYLSAVLFSLRPVPAPGLGTVAVDDGWRLFYDPATIEEWGPGSKANDPKGHDGVAAALAHEVWHCLFETHRRKGDRDMERWNWAEDCSINDGLVAAGWRFPVQCLLPKTFGMKDGLTGEEYYDGIKTRTIKVMMTMPGVGGKCGGCAGNPHDFEKNLPRSGGQGSPLLPPPLHASEQQIVLRSTANAIDQAAAQGRGTMPASLLRWARQNLTPPTVPWQKQLAALVRAGIADRAGMVNYSYARPSRRQWGMRAAFGAQAPIMPAMRSPVPDVGICLDCSGSMMGAPALAARSEIIGIARACGCPVWTYVADTRIAGSGKVLNAADLERLGDTMGGTSMRSALIEIEQKRKHGVLICVSDGFTDWPARGEIRGKLLAAITPGGEEPPTYIPFVQITEAKS